MFISMIQPKTAKAAHTRERMLEVAGALFGERGYAGTTMRAVADGAGVSLGLAYRYFDGKSALVAAIYDRLAARFAAEVRLPEGSWAERGLGALDAALVVLEPHRRTLAVLFAGSAEAPELSPALAPSAARVRAVFAEAVSGATDVPPEAQVLGRSLYLAHLGVLAFWVLDRSAGQAATRELRAWVERILPAVSWAWRAPGVAAAVGTVVGIVERGIGLLPRPTKERGGG